MPNYAPLVLMNLTANHTNHANRKDHPRRGCSRGSGISRFTASGQCPGNLTQDGRWHDTRDAENRLVKLAAGTGAGPQISLQFDYDHQGRRIRQRVWNNPAWSGNPTNDVRYVYDGWNLLASLNPALSVRQAYLWGLDMSGTMQGAGGVGGLLAITDASQGSHFCAYDGNGNVTALVKADGSGLAAQYEYGPFGEPLRATGPMAKANPFRFSTKYTDYQSGLVYYGFRYYGPATGRWPNRDPIDELGGMNLYGIVGNDPIDSYDMLGLFDTGSQGRTDAVKNRATVRADVKNMVDNMLASRDKSCTKGKAIERKRFKPASDTSYAFMYFTGYFLLGQVSVPLDGKGYYEVDCCKQKFGKWEIVIHGSFRDKFDELIPTLGIGGRKGVGSLPITFVGEWVEFYSGSE